MFLRAVRSRLTRSKRIIKLLVFTSLVLYCHFMFRTYENVDGLREASGVVVRVDDVMPSAYVIPTSTTHAPTSGRLVASPRIWPRDDYDVGDRLLNQLEYAQVNAQHFRVTVRGVSEFSKNPDDVEKLRNAGFKIIYSEIYATEDNSGRRPFLHDDCPISSCYLVPKGVQRMRIHFRYDAILINGHSRPNVHLTPDGVLVWFQLESPQHSSSPKNDVNWTATYRRASTLRAPYEFFVEKNPEELRRLRGAAVQKNYAEGKSKMAAIFMSNCRAKNNRTRYLVELQRHLEVDVYGNCGPFKCSKRKSNLCFSILNKDYKFYLAFENSNCRDYITEKFFINGLSNDIVPVVMGAHPDDYRAVAPPHSYIHVDDFESPRHLAEYLKLLNQNDTLYNEYFSWKGTGSFINTKFWCRLCAMLHARDRTNYVHTYSDLETWWKNDQCITTGGHYGATWRSNQNTTTSRYNDKMTAR